MYTRRTLVRSAEYIDNGQPSTYEAARPAGEAVPCSYCVVFGCSPPSAATGDRLFWQRCVAVVDSRTQTGVERTWQGAILVAARDETHETSNWVVVPLHWAQGLPPLPGHDLGYPRLAQQAHMGGRAPPPLVQRKSTRLTQITCWVPVVSVPCAGCDGDGPLRPQRA